MANAAISLLESLGIAAIRICAEAGGVLLLLIASLRWMFIPPFRIKEIIQQMEFVGVKSLLIVLLTGCFTGMVMTLQIYYGFKMFSAESLVGSTVALALLRELAPVLTALMVTARAGSAIAAYLGTMRVTEQIDALCVMAVNPVKYLVVPRIIACVFMMPLLTVFANFMGIIASYFVAVKILGINEGIFIANIVKYCGLSDLYNGLLKATCFGFLIAVISCYKGFYTSGGAEGVGRATTEAVVASALAVLVCDYIITAMML
ncbi:MAG: ABC transporter permease [Deltaproteobacteria bacterium]|nr:ABC transporter permease [Deltaproteobacteria bacterium]